MKTMNITDKTWVYKSVSVYILLISILLITIDCSHKKNRIGFLTHEKIDNQKEIRAAYSFLRDNKSYDSKKISFKEIAQNKDILSHFDLVWFHYPDTSDFPENNITREVIDMIKEYLNNEGNLLLTQNAFSLLPVLGLEKYKPQTKDVEVKDYGYGRKRGFHAFRSHPVFKHMYGGAYIFNPTKDTLTRQVGYFNSLEKINGKTIAVDWAYIRLQEDKKLVLEYNNGNGKVIAIGAYIEFSIPNYDQTLFEYFVNNVIRYETDKSREKAYAWNYADKTVSKFSFDADKIKFPDPIFWNEKRSEIILKRKKASNNSWDIAGQRLVIMGEEDGGIEEIWAHPIMALRDYEIGYRFELDENINWLHNKKPEISLEPHAFTRTYTIEDCRLKEIITTDILKPVGIIHYSYKGTKNIKLYVRFKSNLRYMWPYSSQVFGVLNYAWYEKGNFFIIKDASQDFSSIIGTNKVPHKSLIGQYDSVSLKKDHFIGNPSKKFQVYAISEFFLNSNDTFDVVISASNQGVKKNQDFYLKAIKDPYSVYTNSYVYYKNLLEEKLRLITPNNDFNEGYKWAVVGTDKFFVHTPGIGKSLVAGYATTAHGWDGEHEVNGRPGYAWYFGRDGQWSGFAVDDYGDFEKVREILKQYLDFQDISGKIYHELTTSGVVHYDASDATPLFIVLLGHYLRHSGDIGFIKKNWKKIKKAIDYCYSTDTDNDKLIENKNVGHGWVEGGHLFGGKSTLYLTSCWAAALKNASYIAKILDKTSESQKYKREQDAVVKIINQKFWNNETRFFNHSINDDGSFITEATVMPTIPLYFSQIQENNRSQCILDRLASNYFSSNWGVRIVSEASEYFHPQGYHTGSVWPLFTGWTALAEYKNYKPTQGFLHIMNNLLIYKNWTLGYIEEVLHGAVYRPSGVCSHQCWSETMVVQPVIEGMLGLHPLTPENTLVFSPSLPFYWNDFTVDNIRLGNSYLQMKMTKKDEKVVYRFVLKGKQKLKVDFKPVLPPATEITNITVNGRNLEFNLDKQSSLTIPDIDFTIENKVIVEINYYGGVFVIPDITRPEPEDAAEGLRLISERFENNKFKVVLEAPSRGCYLINLFIENFKLKRVTNAIIKAKNNHMYTLEVDFGEKSTKYFKKEVVVEF